LENVSVGHGVSLLRWRSGGFEHPHDTPPYPIMPSPTFAHSSSHFPIMHYHDNLETLRMEPKYELTDNPPPDTFQKMLASLVKFNQNAVGNAKAHTLAILLKEPTTDELVGGLWGRSLWGSLFVEILFVPAMLRGHGIGTSLLRRAEQEAIRRGCRDIWMETYAFQARTFYEKLGFTIFGRLDGPAPIFPHFFLKKTLSDFG